MQGCFPAEGSSLAVGEEGWWPVVVPVGQEEPGQEEQEHAPSPEFAERWASFHGSTGPGSGGRCLEDNQMFFN